jgi:hypothetical protein
MTPEEYLDYLIQQQLSDASWQPDVGDDDAARLAAAEAVASLNTIAPPLSLSERLEARVRAQARAHQNGHLLTIVPERRNGRVVSLEPRPRTGPRRETGPRPFRFHRAWIGALGTAAVLLLALLGVSNVAAGSLPGDPLYGVKHFEQQIALSGAMSPDGRATLQITQLQNALDDLQTEVSNGRSEEDIRQALTIVAADTQQSQTAVAAVPAGTARDAAEQSLATTLQNEQTVLYALLARVGWSLQVVFTRQLGALGVAVPAVTQVTVIRGATTTLTVKLTGVNFAPGAQLVINGRVRGTVTQNTGTTLTATINQSDWRVDDGAVGMVNPDGTAAQKFVGEGPDDGSNDDGRQGTPVPGSTPTPGGNDGDDSGSGH